jgi:hypothetical protein
MAQLAFGIAGAVVGSFFGMPQLGFVVGSILGQLLFPTKQPDQQGPRLGDLSVMTSVYGAPWAICYGTFRQSGNMIWSRPLIEKEADTHSGGKGGMFDGPKQKNYNYYATFAVGFAQCTSFDVLRIWFDKKLVYDSRSATMMNNIQGAMRFYNGSETQMPDPVMEAWVGAGLAPAHRGLTYILFDTIAVNDYGRRIPQVEAEIAYTGTGATPTRLGVSFGVPSGGLFNGYQSSGFAVDRRRRKVYVVGSNSPSGPSGLRIFNMDTLVEERQKLWTDITSDASIPNAILCVGDSGFIYTSLGSGIGPLIKIDPNSLEEIGRVGIFAGFFDTTHYVPSTIPEASSLCEATMLDPTTGARRYFLISASFLDNNITIVDADRMLQIYQDALGTYTLSSNLNVDITGIVAFPLNVNTIGTAVAYFAQQQAAAPNSPIYIWKITIDSSYVIVDSVSNRIGFCSDSRRVGRLDGRRKHSESYKRLAPRQRRPAVSILGERRRAPSFVHHAGHGGEGSRRGCAVR